MSSRTWRVCVGLAVVGALSARSAAAQGPPDADLRREVQALGEAVKAMQQDLKEIKALLQRAAPPPAPPQSIVLDLAGRPSKGKATATLTLVEFSDFQCPFCGRHVSATEPQLTSEYVDTGRLKVVFMDFPLEAIHPLAFKAAETARCAGEQGKFWDMHDQLFRTQATPAEFSNWAAQARKVGLAMPEFERCLNSGRHAGGIRKDLAQGLAAGVNGTPGFFLAVTDPASTTVKTVRFISGAQPYAVFKAQIDALLTQQAALDGKNR